MEISLDCTKESLRKCIKERVKLLSDSEKKRQSEAVIEKLIKLSNRFQSKNVLAFMPMDDEVNIFGFISFLLENSFNVYVPTSFDASCMEFYRLYRLDEIKIGKYGIREAVSLEKYNYSLNDSIIVPGVSFDISGNRLGRGKGYYDIFLRNHKLDSIGVCFNEQIVENIILDEHDVPVDMLVTENLDFKK